MTSTPNPEKLGEFCLRVLAWSDQQKKQQKKKNHSAAMKRRKGKGHNTRPAGGVSGAAA